jgi:hypothetical protein
MAHPDDLAGRILKLEQQLEAYERLHGGELAELWQALNECKRAIANDLPDHEPNLAEQGDAQRDLRASRQTIVRDG